MVVQPTVDSNTQNNRLRGYLPERFRTIPFLLETYVTIWRADANIMSYGEVGGFIFLIFHVFLTLSAFWAAGWMFVGVSFLGGW